MNIRVAMLDNDFNYLSKISRALNMKYKGKIELYIFTDKEMLLETIKNDKVHVLIVNKQLLDFNELELEYKFSKAYFCESPNVESIVLMARELFSRWRIPTAMAGHWLHG